MLVGDFLDRLKKGETVTGIGEKLGIHRKTIQRRLKKLGYVWDAEQLRWKWAGGVKEEPLHVSLTEMHSSWQPEHAMHHYSYDVNEGEMRLEPECVTSSESSSHPFTEDELRDLKEMLAQWRESAAAAVTHERDLIERIEEIKQGSSEKVRKTIVIDKQIGNELDLFAEKTRLNKSDILHLAIQELIEKYR